MSKRCLIFLCKKFPYGNGEDFISQELNYYENKFDKIILVATQVNKKDTITKYISPKINNIKITIEYNLFFAIELLKTIFKYKKIAKYEKFFATSLIKKIYLIFFYVRFSVAIKKIIKNGIIETVKQYPEIVILSYWFNDLCMIGIELKKIICANDTNNIKCVILSRAHGYDLYKERSIVKYFPFRELILNNIDIVLSCSKDGTNYLKINYNKYNKKFITNYLGTILNSKHSLNININKNKFTIVTCSNLIKLKRLILVAETLNYLENNKNITNIRWICIGDGNQLPRIKKYCSKNLKKIDVTFTGKLKNVDVLTLYCNEDIDVFLNVSKYEGLPVSMMEALSCGIPIIATDVGGVNEIVINNKTGQLLNKNFEISELANIITQFIDMSINDKKKYKYQCKKLWEKKYNAKKNYENTIKIINHILNVS